MNTDSTHITPFIFRMGMYIPKIDKYNIISFLIGNGVTNDFYFTKKISEYLEENQSIKSDSLSWSGQIIHYAERKRVNWVTAFIQISLEIIALENPESFSKYKLINRIKGIQTRIEKEGLHGKNRREWESFCSSPNLWFRELWTAKEYEHIQHINQRLKI